MNQNALRRVFGRSRVFLPVINPVSKATAIQSIDTAVRSGADGNSLSIKGCLPPKSSISSRKHIDGTLVCGSGQTFLAQIPKKLSVLLPIVPSAESGPTMPTLMSSRTHNLQENGFGKHARGLVGRDFTSVASLSSISEKCPLPCCLTQPGRRLRGWMSSHRAGQGPATPQRWRRQGLCDRDQGHIRWHWPAA